MGARKEVTRERERERTVSIATKTREREEEREPVVIVCVCVCVSGLQNAGQERSVEKRCHGPLTGAD